MPGATRDWKNWRKTWQDLKSRTKTKLSNAKRHARGTGGGPPIEGEYSKMEEEIINIVKVVSIEGHKKTAESAVNFNFDDDHNILEEQQNENITIEEEPSEKINEERVPITPETLIPRKKKSSTLRHTIDAVENFKVGMDAKIALKTKYYDKKLELLKRITYAKEKKANAVERAASANERIATALEKIAECNNF